MKKVTVFLLFAVLLLQNRVDAAVPFPVFKSPGPGLNLPFEVDGSIDAYGWESTLDLWSFDGWSGTSTDSIYSLARYYTTLENAVPINPEDQNDISNMTAMPADKDWVFRVQYNHRNTDGWWIPAFQPIKLTHKDPNDPNIEYKIFAVVCQGDPNTISFQGATAANQWDTTSGGIFPIVPWADIVVHYIASGPVLELFYNGQYKGTYAIGHGRYDADWLEFNCIGGGEDSFRKFAIGQYENRPEPGQLYFWTGQPGLSVPFASNDAPNIYGKKDSASGWTFDGSWGSASAAAQATYRTTLANSSTVTGMSDANDWYLEFTYDHNDVNTVEGSVLTLKREWNGARESRIIRLEIDPDPGRTVLYASDANQADVDDANAGWYVVAQDIKRGLGPNGGRYVIHYKADTRKMDAYYDGQIVAADFVTGHGHYDPDSLKISWSGAGVDKFKNLKITTSATPPPACGDGAHPYPVSDLSKDCVVNFKDFAILASHWIECTDVNCN